MASQPKNKRTLRIEELESRDLLSFSPFGSDYLDVPGNNLYETEQIAPVAQSAPVVAAAAPTAAEFAAIRAKYADLNLSANMEDYHIITVEAANLTDFDMRAAITEAQNATGKSLIVVRTTAVQNKITLGGSQLTVNGGTAGITIVSFGDTDLTLDANKNSRVFSTSGTVALAGLVITGGHAGEGGGILNNTNGRLTVTWCTLSGNEATAAGGGIYSMSTNTGMLTVTHSTISGNTASSGGGISGQSGVSTPANIANSIISGNTVTGSGGGIFGISELNVTNCSILDNMANNGGGISGLSGYVGSANITNSILTGNIATGSGGGIFGVTTLSVVNSVIAGNTANSGGGIGGDHNLRNSTITNCTIVGNVAEPDLGGGIYGGLGTTTLNNTIVALNSSDIDVDPIRTTLTGNYNLLGSGTGQTSFMDGINGNIVGRDPLFVDLQNGNLRLANGSPAIDAGRNELAVGANNVALTTDLDGGQRIRNEIVDMGCYEYGGGPVVTIPATPANLRSTEQTPSTVSLAWDAVTGATSYQIQYRTGNGNWSTANITMNGTTAIISGLTAGTAYEFQVRATNNSGSSPWSTSVSATTDDEGVPTLPTPTGLQSTAQTPNSVSLSWGAVTGATSYQIQYRTGNGNWSTANVAMNGTAATVSGLSASTSYEIQVRAANNGDLSAWSASVFVVTTTGEVPPITGTTTTNSATFTFPRNDLPGNLNDYQLRYRVAGQWVTSTSTFKASGNNATITITGLQPNTAYDIQVVRKSGETLETVTNAVKTNALAAVKASAFRTDAATIDSLVISWKHDALNNASGYLILPPAGVSQNQISAITINAVTGRASVTITGLNPGKSYKFTVSSTNLDGKSKANVAYTAKTTAAAAAVKASAFRTDVANIDSVVFSWKHDGSNDASGYQIFPPAGVSQDQISDITVDPTTNRASVTITGLNPGKAYKFTVYSTNLDSTSPVRVSATYTAKTAAYTAVTGLKQTKSTLGLNTITLEWNQSTVKDTNGYEIVMKSGSGKNVVSETFFVTVTNGMLSVESTVTGKTLEARWVGSKISLKIVGLSSATKYTFTVTAVTGTFANPGTKSATTKAVAVVTPKYMAVTNAKIKQTVVGQVTLGWNDAKNMPTASSYDVGIWVGKAAVFNQAEFDEAIKALNGKAKDTAIAVWAEISGQLDSVAAKTVTFYGVTQKIAFAVRATAEVAGASVTSAIAKIAVTPLKYPAPATLTQPTPGTMMFTWTAPNLKNVDLPATAVPAGAVQKYEIGLYDTKKKDFADTTDATYKLVEPDATLTATLDGVVKGNKVAVAQVITFANGNVVKSAVKVLTVK